MLQQKNKQTHVLIDAGHGSNTPGKGSPYSLSGTLPAIEFREWKWTREIADRIVSELRCRGIEANLLVTEQYDVSLLERVKRVNEKCRMYGKDNVLVISIHNNALGMGDKWENNARGWSVWTSVGQTKSDLLAEYLFTRAKENFKDMRLRSDVTDNDNDCESQFYILRKTLCPAVLTENFFMTAEEDLKYILSNKGKDAIVATHIQGIMDYIQNQV